MDFRVRQGRPEDVADIVPWTTDTFDWGDYVPDRLADWIASPDSYVTVCVTDDDKPVAVAHTVMLSPTEAWLEAARVHPDYKRRGMANAMNREGTHWAATRGARVARLATEARNQTARLQVESFGYRHTSTWVAAWLEPGTPTTIREGDRLRPSPTAEVEPAWLSWGLSELAMAGHELISQGWRFRRATPLDLAEASREGRLLQSPAGWLIADQSSPNRIRTGWASTSPEQAPVLLAALAAHASSVDAEEVDVFTPSVPWMVEALTRAGGEPEEVLIYTLAL
jgi:hypothetical protein